MLAKERTIIFFICSGCQIAFSHKGEFFLLEIAFDTMEILGVMWPLHVTEIGPLNFYNNQQLHQKLRVVFRQP